MTGDASPGRPFDIIAIGTSAGGLQALEVVLGALPGDLPVPVVVVQHLDPEHRSRLADILARHTSVEVRRAVHGVRPCDGVVHVAVPGHHLLVADDRTLALDQSEPVRFGRPSVDRLFESIAGSYGDRAVAVVLTGTGSDGATGVEAVKEQGGTVVVEDPGTARFSAMPAAAVDTGRADLVLSLDAIGPALLALVTDDRGGGR